MIRDRLRTTETRDGRKAAVWQIDTTSAARILRLEVRDTDDRARVIELPEATDLPTARELHPEHTALWDRIRDERAAAVLDTRELPAWKDPAS